MKLQLKDFLNPKMVPEALGQNLVPKISDGRLDFQMDIGISTWPEIELKVSDQLNVILW
jgi:hypothetical protein